MRLFLIKIVRFSRSSFWQDAATLDDSSTPHVLPGVLLFGAVAALICLYDWCPWTPRVKIDLTSFEFGGAMIGLLLVVRTNEGIGRWWEARKLWGGITNQCRNLGTVAVAYGPPDPAWRRAAVSWTIVYAHVCRRSLRNEDALPEVAALVGDDQAARVAQAQHMPTYVALVLARILRVAYERMGMDRLAFLQADQQRTTLIDHLGGCERILKTPMPRAYSIQIRQFSFIFLGMLPFGLIGKIGWWLTPLITMIVAYPLLSLDKIGAELQKPFSTTSLNHLDLDAITTTIEGNLLGLLDGEPVSMEIDALMIDLDEGLSTSPEGMASA